MTEFAMGFEATARVILLFFGGCVAVVLLAALMMLALILAATVFDWITNSLAKRWEKKGHVPRNKLERIILESFRRKGG